MPQIVQFTKESVMKMRSLLSIPARRAATSLVLALATIATGTAITVFANDTKKPWTTVGSAGTVDEEDLSIFNTNDRNISLNAPQLPATLDVRYNIVAVDGIALPDDLEPESIFMKVRYRDMGSNGQIVLQLKKYNLNTGSNTTLLTFDSNSAPQTTAPQVQQVSTNPCAGTVKFDFVNNAYYIDAQLTQTSFASFSELPPLLALIQVGADTDPCPPK
jgi:hypothetical protein